MLQLPEISGPVHTPEWAIEGVPPGDAMVPWRRCWELLQRAVDRFPDLPEKYTSDSLLYSIMVGECQLWIAWSYDRRKIEGAVVTRVLDNCELAPNDRICQCLLVGGDNLMEWAASMFAMLRAWAAEQDCQYIGGCGRRGWKRLFGFHEMGKTSEGLPIFVMSVRKH